MSCLWWEANDNDTISNGIVKELIGEVGAMFINNEKASAAVGHDPGLDIRTCWILLVVFNTQAQDIWAFKRVVFWFDQTELRSGPEEDTRWHACTRRDEGQSLLLSLWQC